MKSRMFYRKVQKPERVLVANQQDLKKILSSSMDFRELTTNWIKNVGCNYEDFFSFIKQIGINAPFKICEVDKKKNSFKCITSLGEEFQLSLYYGDLLDYCPRIVITDGEETRCYDVYVKATEEAEGFKTDLQTRVIQRDGKKLESFYCEYFCRRTLNIDDTHILKVEVDEPKKNADNSEILVLQNKTDIEKYLMGLDNPISVEKVFNKVIELLKFSNKDIEKCANIKISYTEKEGKEERVRGIILLFNGQMPQYATLENGETFHVFKNGNWSYTSDSGIKIDYAKDTNKYIFSMTGTEVDVTAVNPSDIMKRVKLKISDFWKFVN